MIEITLKIEMEPSGSMEEVVVRGRYFPGSQGTMYLANGDPGDPPEPEDVEIHSASLHDGTPWELTDRQQREAEEKIIESARG
jgi:hypothetical protein